MKHSTLKWLLMSIMLCVGVGAWGQGDYSSDYTGNVTLSTAGGTSASSVKVKLSSSGTEYAAIKAGTSSKAGAVKITVPKDTKYLHLHVAAWNGESVTLSVTPSGYSSNISLTSDSGISGSSPTFTLGTPANATSSYYKVITFTNALTSNTDLTFTASSGKRFVVWGVTAEAASTDPSSAAAFTYTEPSINFPATTTYTQAATTADGYTGTVTYTITANTAGATLEGTTLTVTQEGSVTVKATAPAITGWAKSEATYTLTVNDTRSVSGLAYATATQNVVVGEVLSAPTLTNPNSLAVTYSSLDETIATVDASGNVTGVKIGSTTIKATFDGDASYKAGSASYTINVTKAPFAIEDGVFDFVEAANADPFEDYESGMVLSSDYTTEDKTWTAGNVTMVTSKVSGNGYRWWSNDGTLRFYDESKATFSVPEGYVITEIVTTGANFDKASTGTLSGSTWTGVASSVALSATATRNIKKIEVTYGATASVTLNGNGYATFAANAPLDFSDDSDFSAWQITSANSSTGVITFTQIEGTVAPGTGVLLVGDASETINVPVATSGTDISATNKLVGITASTVVTAGQYYGLKGNEFVPVKAGTVPACKALLPVSAIGSGAAAKALTFVFSDASGIDTVREMPVNDGAIYNLAGQRMQQLQKGINIVNGKKVFVK